ncbi:MAG: hypothetical protein ACJAYU_005101 [Bradymonadia bacterium]
MVDVRGEEYSTSTGLGGTWQIALPAGAYEVCWEIQLQGECGEAQEFVVENSAALPVVIPLDTSNVWGTILLANGTPCVGEVAAFDVDLQTDVVSGDYRVRANTVGEFVLLDDGGSATFTCEGSSLEALLVAGDSGEFRFENSPPELLVLATTPDGFTNNVEPGQEFELDIEVSDPDGDRIELTIDAPDVEVVERGESRYFTVPEEYDGRGFAIRVLAGDGNGGYAVSGLEFAVSQSAYSVDGQVTDADGAPVAGATIRSADQQWATSDDGFFEAELNYDGRRALRVQAPGYVPRLVEVAGEHSGLAARLTRCEPIAFDATSDATFTHPSDERLQVHVPARSLRTADGEVVEGNAIACMAWLDGTTAIEMFGTQRIAAEGADLGDDETLPGSVGFVEPIGVGYVEFTREEEPESLLVWPEDSPDLQPTLTIDVEGRELGESQGFATVSLDLERGSWEIDGPNEGVQALVSGAGSGGGITGGVAFVPIAPERDYPFISSCIMITLHGRGPSTVNFRVQDASGATLWTSTRPLPRGRTTRYPGLPPNARVFVDTHYGDRLVLDTGVTTTPHFNTGTIFPTDCGAHVVLPDNPYFGQNLRYSNVDGRTYIPITNAGNGGALYNLNSWMVDNGWPHTAGIPDVSPYSADDADLIFNSQSSAPTARRVYSNRVGPPGNADLAMLLASGVSHGSWPSKRNWIGISFRRAIPTGPRVVQFFWFDQNGNQLPDGGGGWWSEPDHAPQNCQNCHGGIITATPPADGNLGASMIPFDIANMTFNGQTFPGTSRVIDRASQEDAIRALNEMLLSTNLMPEHRERILGLYGVTNPAAVTIPVGAVQDTTWRPLDWASEPEFYDDVVRPTCLGCHSSRGSIVGSATDFLNNAALIQLYVCRNAWMRVGALGSDSWWTSVNPHRPNALVEAMVGVPGWTDLFCNY